jgi:hypothetical protein
MEREKVDRQALASLLSLVHAMRMAAFASLCTPQPSKSSLCGSEETICKCLAPRREIGRLIARPAQFPF